MVVPGHVVEEPGARRDTAVQLKITADLATERKRIKVFLFRNMAETSSTSL